MSRNISARNYRIGDSVKVINPSLDTFNRVGIIVGFKGSKRSATRMVTVEFMSNGRKVDYFPNELAKTCERTGQSMKPIPGQRIRITNKDMHTYNRIGLIREFRFDGIGRLTIWADIVDEPALIEVKRSDFKVF